MRQSGQCSIRYRRKGKGHPGKDNPVKVKRKEFNYGEPSRQKDMDFKNTEQSYTGEDRG